MGSNPSCHIVVLGALLRLELLPASGLWMGVKEASDNSCILVRSWWWIHILKLHKIVLQLRM